MTGRPPESLHTFRFHSLSRPELAHAVFTRHGGVSPTPWASLNFSISTGDTPERTGANRRRALAALGRDPESMADVWQVGSNRVLRADRPQRGVTPELQADGLITDRREVTLLMRFADCVPLLLFDPRRGAIGLVHAGWKGTVLRAAAAGVRAMSAAYGCHPADLLAGIGPSIGPDHYEIGPDVIAQVQAAFPAEWPALVHRPNGAPHFDLWAANRLVLEQAGVGQIEVAGVCTACNVQDYFSHRAERGRTGRFGAVLALQ